MVVRRRAHSMVFYQGHVYAFGGMDEKGKVTASVERIRYHTGEFGSKWEQVASMPIACCNVGLVVVH